MYKGILAYDGTNYFGWQKTSSKPSIQGELQKAISRITNENPLPEAASRTDRGVHAEGQVVQFALVNGIDPAKLQQALNAVLPKDIRLVQLTYKSFHPTIDAIGKEYHYQICQHQVQDPIHRLYSWHYPQFLDLEKMEETAKDFLGTNDYSAFANEREKNPICRIEKIELISNECNRLRIRIIGDRFLYKMARNIVGTLVYVGCGKLSSVKEILKSRDRKLAGITAPAQGLYLHQVFYPLK